MKIGVLGSGSWGTTLALVLNENRHDVTCWSYKQEVIDDISKTGENSRFLPGIKIPDSMHYTTDAEKCIKDAEIVIVAVPSQAIRGVLEALPKEDNDKRIWVSVSKGIENKTLKRVTEVIGEVRKLPGEQLAVFSGPSHAEEVSRHIPTTIVSASTSIKTAELVQTIFTTPYLRVYANPDVIGVELGGALKNVIAMAAGICDGAGFGDNTKAALITRALVEMNRLGVKMGAQANTFAGLSGMGDLIVTCMSKHSRNRHVGEQIGKGRSLQEILDEMVMVAEGVRTTESVHFLAERENVEMPISEQVYKTLFEGKSPIEAVRDLMTRESKTEDWG